MNLRHTLNRFDSKRIALFNTFNGEFKPDFITQFEAWMMERGAHSFEHRSIRRGRMTRKRKRGEMLQAIEVEGNLGS